MVVFPLPVNQNEAATSGTTWPTLEGELTHDVTWLQWHGNANICGMAFEDDFTSNVAINKDIVPIQRLSRSKACEKVELIAKYIGIWAWTSQT